MIDILRSRLDNTHSLEYQRHQVREFLQHIILRILSKGKRFSHIAFVGGTCLRICHQLPRYSEDLDFSLIQPQGYDFLALIKYLQRELVLYNFTISIKYKRGTIDACTIRFGKLLYNLGLSPLPDQNLSIKIEIDTNPPLGYQLVSHTISQGFLYPLRAFDLPSLFAGKLHALIFRPFIKGRDRYDLVWYLANNILPNYKLLTEAEYQSTRKKTLTTWTSVRQRLLDHLSHITHKQLLDDVEQFLQRHNDRKLLHPDHITNQINTVMDQAIPNAKKAGGELR